MTGTTSIPEINRMEAIRHRFNQLAGIKFDLLVESQTRSRLAQEKESPISRDAAVVTLAEAAAITLSNQDFGLDFVPPTRPGDIDEAGNLYSSDPDGHRVAIRAIDWIQTLRWGTPAWGRTAPFPSELYFGQIPKIGQANKAHDRKVADVPNDGNPTP